jgi:hypothetical protein
MRCTQADVGQGTVHFPHIAIWSHARFYFIFIKPQIYKTQPVVRNKTEISSKSRNYKKMANNLYYNNSMHFMSKH